jgi:phage baseplate assembly protein W
MKPIGIKTPLSLSNSDDIFEMNYSLFTQIEDNFKNLIRTNSGERLCFPSFGTNIRSILTRTDLENPQELAMQEIQRVTSRYMPFINLVSFSNYIDEIESKKGNPVIVLKIGYSVPTISAEQRLIILKLGMTH